MSNEIQTKFGKMVVIVNDRFNICVRSERDADLRINGSNWPVTAHLRDHQDGYGFVPLRRKDHPASIDYQWLYSSRWSDKKRTWENITPAARLRLEEALPEAVNAWVMEQPEVLAEAQRESIHNQIERADGEIEELQGKIKELEAKKLELMGQLVVPAFNYTATNKQKDIL